jgi:hypothetical protein
LAEQPEEGQRSGEHQGDALNDVAPAEVTEFMRQHGFDFIRRQTVEQGVEKDNALVVAEAGEVGVAVAGTLRAIHHEQPARAETATGKQGFDALFISPSSSGENLLNSGAIQVG